MKTFNKLLVFFTLGFLAFSPNILAQETESSASGDSWKQIGEEFNPSHALNTDSAHKIYQSLNTADSVSLNFKAKVTAVCKVKGCWMDLELEDSQTARITFKDYGFFVPTDIEGKEVFVSGVATISEIDEATRKHYATDAGLSEEEINKISGSEKTYSMVANGVIIPN